MLEERKMGCFRNTLWALIAQECRSASRGEEGEAFLLVGPRTHRECGFGRSGWEDVRWG